MSEEKSESPSYPMYDTDKIEKFEKNIKNDPSIDDNIVDTEFRNVARKRYLVVIIDTGLDESGKIRNIIENKIINSEKLRNIGYDKYDEDDNKIGILVNNI